MKIVIDAIEQPKACKLARNPEIAQFHAKNLRLVERLIGHSHTDEGMGHNCGIGGRAGGLGGGGWGFGKGGCGGGNGLGSGGIGPGSGCWVSMQKRIMMNDNTLRFMTRPRRFPGPPLLLRERQAVFMNHGG